VALANLAVTQAANIAFVPWLGTRPRAAISAGATFNPVAVWHMRRGVQGRLARMGSFLLKVGVALYKMAA